MNRKNLLNRLKLEIEDSLPDSNKVLNKVKSKKVEKDLKPVYEAINSNGTVAIKTKQNVMFISGIMVLTMLLFTLFLIFLPVLNKMLYPEKNIVTKFGIDINPSIDLMLDENDSVVVCLAKNKHAQLLIGDENFIGKNVNDVVERVVTLATMAGYIDPDVEPTEISNAVLISAINEDDSKQRKLLESAKDIIKNFYLTNQIYGVVLTEFDSKQELVDMVCSLEYGLTEEEQVNLKNESVKNLNKRLCENYINLKRRFKSDFVLEELFCHISPINNTFNSKRTEAKIKLTEFEQKLNNFETSWKAETALCEDKVNYFETKLLSLRNQLATVENLQEKAALQIEIARHEKFLLDAKEELEGREVNGLKFQEYKQLLNKQINQYKENINNFRSQCLSQIEQELKIVKEKFNTLKGLMSSRKDELIKNNEAVLNEHFKNMGNYNDFYNSYLTWVNDLAIKVEKFRTEWSQNKTNWEHSFENYVKF